MSDASLHHTISTPSAFYEEVLYLRSRRICERDVVEDEAVREQRFPQGLGENAVGRIRLHRRNSIDDAKQLLS